MAILHDRDQCQLTLRFTRYQDTIAVTWDADVLGRRTSTFRQPYGADVLPLVIRALDASQFPNHPLHGPTFDQAEREQLAALGLWANTRVAHDIHQSVGTALHAALTSDPAGAGALRTVRDYATAHALSITYLLRFPPDAAELATLPWEVLWDHGGALLMSRGKLATCIRYLDLDQALPPARPPGHRLCILAISPAAGIPTHVRGEERAARQDAWRPLIDTQAVTMEELHPATPQLLVDRLQHGPPVDVIHYYGRGHYAHGKGSILLDTADGGQTWVDVDRLATLLNNVCLVMLHACQSGRVSSTGLLTGVAPALSAAGVPAVVAMQMTIRIAAATRFAGVVYRSLAQGGSLQHAVSNARQALYVEENEGVSWYVPTLTIRARDTEPLRLVQPLPPDQAPVASAIPAPPTDPSPATPAAMVGDLVTPFVVGPPILEPRAFFGRERIVRRIFDQIRHPPLQNTIIIGPRRSGKTSLLYYLQTINRTPADQLRPGQRANWLRDPERHQWVYVDFQDARLGTREGVLRHLLTRLNLTVPDPCTLDRFLEVMSSQIRTPVVILLDEIGKALQSYAELDDDFWESLRSLGPQVGNNLGFVLTATTSPTQLAHTTGHSSPFFNIFGYTAKLPPLSEQEARELIASAPRPFAPDDVAWILQHSGRWPILLQLLCRERLEALEYGEDNDSWRREALTQAEPLRHLLDAIPFK